MSDPARALQGAFAPINSTLTLGLANSVGTTAIVLFADSTSPTTIRRIHVYNRSTTATLALCVVPLGQAPAAESVSSGLEIGPGGTLDVCVRNNLRVLIVASAAATSFSAACHDT